jgi:predicted RNase H-like HicB family nuclease
MPIELTAVYEPQANGSVIAYVAELPAVTVGGHNLEEARAGLAERLRLFLEQERDDVLSRVGPGARVESVRIEIGSHRDTRAELDADLATRVEIDVRPRSPQLDHDAGNNLVDYLVQIGLLAAPVAVPDSDDFEPVCIQGRPVSEEIIEARR